MLEPEKVDNLREQARRVKTIFPDANGSVTFHLSEQNPPKVEVRLCDVTKKK